MSRSNAKPSARDALKTSERFSHPSPLENALDFLLTPQAAKVASHNDEEVAIHNDSLLAIHNDARIASHQNDAPEASKLATNHSTVASKLAALQVASYPQEEKAKDRHDRSKVQLNTRITRETDQLINESRVVMKMTRQEFVEVAIHRFAEWIASHKDGLVASELAHDDVMNIFKTDDKIITLYCEITGNKWKHADDRAAHRFNDADLRVVERGMLAAAIRTKARKINSFNYFVQEIEIAMEQHADTSDDIKNVDVKSLRKYWERKRAGKPLID